MVKCAGYVNVAFGVSMRTVVAVYTCVCVRVHACGCVFVLEVVKKMLNEVLCIYLYNTI